MRSCCELQTSSFTHTQQTFKETRRKRILYSRITVHVCLCVSAPMIETDHHRLSGKNKHHAGYNFSVMRICLLRHQCKVNLSFFFLK